MPKASGKNCESSKFFFLPGVFDLGKATRAGGGAADIPKDIIALEFFFLQCYTLQ